MKCVSGTRAQLRRYMGPVLGKAPGSDGVYRWGQVVRIQFSWNLFEANPNDHASRKPESYDLTPFTHFGHPRGRRG